MFVHPLLVHVDSLQMLFRLDIFGPRELQLNLNHGKNDIAEIEFASRKVEVRLSIAHPGKGSRQLERRTEERNCQASAIMEPCQTTVQKLVQTKHTKTKQLPLTLVTQMHVSC